MPSNKQTPEELDAAIRAAESAFDALAERRRRVGAFLKVEPNSAFARQIDYQPDQRFRALEIYAAVDDAEALVNELRAARARLNLSAIPTDDDELSAQAELAWASYHALKKEAADLRGHAWRLGQSKQTRVEHRRAFTQNILRYDAQAMQARAAAERYRQERAELAPFVQDAA